MALFYVKDTSLQGDSLWFPWSCYGLSKGSGRRPQRNETPQIEMIEIVDRHGPGGEPLAASRGDKSIN